MAHGLSEEEHTFQPEVPVRGMALDVCKRERGGEGVRRGREERERGGEGERRSEKEEERERGEGERRGREERERG